MTNENKMEICTRNGNKCTNACTNNEAANVNQ